MYRAKSNRLVCPFDSQVFWFWIIFKTFDQCFSSKQNRILVALMFTFQHYEVFHRRSTTCTDNNLAYRLWERRIGIVLATNVTFVQKINHGEWDGRLLRTQNIIIIIKTLSIQMISPARIRCQRFVWLMCVLMCASICIIWLNKFEYIKYVF